MPNPAADGKPKAARSQTLERGLDILETVMASPGCSLSDVASERGLSYSTVHRIAAVLAARGYLHMASGNRLTLGARLMEAGFIAYRSLDIVRLARPWLERLAASSGETVHLARLEGGNVVYLDKIASTRPMEIRTSIGSVRPAVATGVGKALLLDWPEDRLRALFEAERDKVIRNIDTDGWLAEMRDFAAAGHAFDLGDAEPEIRCVSAPIRDAGGMIVAALSLSTAQAYLPPERMQALVPAVTEAARGISGALGYR